MSELRVRVPATSANLGPGFDSFALALPLSRSSSCAGQTWSGRSRATAGPADEENLFVVAAHANREAGAARADPQHVTQRRRSRSHAASDRVRRRSWPELWRHNALLGEPFDRARSCASRVKWKEHADNVAAAIYGAFTVALPNDGGPVATRLVFPRTWRVCLLIPSRPLSTQAARAVLPSEVSRDDAVFNVAHGAALIAAVMRADGPLLALAMADRLHQPARMKLVPALGEIIAAAREAGAFGAALSGAGPSVLAVAPTGSLRASSPRWRSPLRPRALGTRRVVRVRAAGAQVFR